MGCGPCTARKCCGCKSCAEGRRPNRAFNPNDNIGNAAFTTGLRGKVKLQVDESDDFLSHHLINQLSLSKHASSHKIRARQIIQHYMFSQINRAKDTGQVSTSKLTEFALKSWFQRTFYQALQKAEKAFLVDKKKYELVRAQLCQEYIFEIYHMGEFINAGFSRFSTADRHIEVPLSLVLLNSDSALYPLLTILQENYPLVDPNAPVMSFPPVPKLSNRPNILKYFNSKSYADPDHLNAQTLMDDLKFIIDEANDLKQDFKSDMIDLIGAQSSEFDCKVKRLQGKDAGFYKAEAVRRVFIKWTETLIDEIPDVYKLNEFIDFIKSKKKVAEQFIFGGVVSPSTHQRVIECLTQLLQSLKYQNGTKNMRDHFGLYIYDFLRCKTTRNTAQDVVKLLNKLMSTKTTKSGKRFEVVRIKNRFQKATRDLLINFRYGQHIIGQAQLAVDTSHESQDVARRIKFRHLLYELHRGLFGPTFEMIMLLQDATRTNIKVNLTSEGPIKKRNLQIDSNHKIKLANRKCPQEHQMIELSNNIFADEKITGIVQNAEQFNFCDFCFNKFYFNQPYHYCYYCSIFYCTFCLNTFQKTDRKNMQLLGTNHDKLRIIDNPKHLQKLCEERKSAIVVFYRPNTSASMLFLDQIAYLITAFVSLSKPLPQIYILNVSKKDFQPLLEQLKIDRTPTTVIFNSKVKSQVTIIGASFHDIESLLKVKDRIAKGQPKGLSLKCTQCHLNMVAKPRDDSNKNKCQICMDTSKIQDLKDAVRQFFNETSDFVCKSGHVRCAYCSYLSSDRPSYYRDYTGRTYLSNKFVSQPSICKQDHDMESVPQPSQYKCDNCNRQYKGNSDENISYCKECKVYMCIECEETDTQNYKDKQYKSLLLKQVEIVNHFVENRLEESYPCGCGKYFLKVYSSRRLNQQIKIANAFKQLMNQGAIPWNCAICHKEEVRLRLHLACFYCSYAQKKAGKPAHTQICFDCALKSRLVPHQPQIKIDEQVSKLKCSKGHQTILTSRRNNNDLFYDCSSCRRSFYPFTLRYECRQCRLKYCKECSDKNLVMNQIFTSQRCSNSHSLVFEKRPLKLQFCKKCSIFLQGPHFRCTDQICSSLYCLNCISGDFSNK